jgi:ABC-2 type transport system ATP-binding protein
VTEHAAALTHPPRLDHATVTAAIVAEGLRKSYGELVAVDDVSFTVEAGEIFGILGPNGAGKTTTLEIVEGLREPDAGGALVLGLPSWPRNLSLLPRMGVQLQTSAFFERLTAREQLRVFVSMYDAPPSQVDAALALVGLEDRADERVEKLSGGQAQRLALACALAHDPEIVFLDEPTAGLDPQARRNLWDVIEGIRAASKTVVLTTHYLEEAEELCDRVAILDHGRVLALDTPLALVRSLGAAVQVLIAAGQIDEHDAASLPGVVNVRPDGALLGLETRDPNATLGMLADRRALDGVEVRGATLEDVFFALTGREYRA